MSTSIPLSTLEKFTTFGDLLRFLRRRVGMTQMELSIAVGYSDTQISRLEQNLRLPDIPTIEARFLSALDLESEPKAVARLLELAANVRREDAPALGLCPYKGLNYFEEADADLFVGRETLTNKLVERLLSLASRSSPHQERFLAVVGASGSGKSSLVRAGLIPALRWNTASADWQVHILTPTAHPLESLAASFTQGSDSISATATLMDDLARDSRSLHLYAKRRLGSGNGSRILLVVDQFEELFALCRAEEERALFIGSLLTAVSGADAPVLVVITLRADFYAHCANYFQLREALASHQAYIGAMNSDELRRTIEEPAKRGRWEFEPGLIDLLLHDVGNEPGALPLLSHALLETWQRRRGRLMTLSGYAASGGVRGAIAETAESVFTDQFTREQQIIARRIFLRLTELSEESATTADTRRRATFDELILKPEEAATTHVVLKALADARLIMTSEDSAEVAHEALIREWPTLRGWLEENREGLRLHQQLTEAANEWITMNREPDFLFRGGRLAQVREWAITHADEMNAAEQDFLVASQARAEHEATEREAQRQRELEAAQKLVETERARAEEQEYSANHLRIRNQIISSVGSIAILLAILAVFFAFNSSHNAQQAQDNLVLANQERNAAQNAQATAQVASTRAIADFTHAEAERLAAEADSLRLSNGDTNLIALLAIQSLHMQYTPAGDAVLTSLTGFETPPREFKGHTDYIYGVAISPDGKYLATGSVDKTIRLWDIATGETIKVLNGHTDTVEGVVFSPDGKYLLTSCDDGTARLWDVATGQTVKVFTTTSGMGYIAFSPDGKYFVSASPDSVGRIWDVASGEIVHTLIGHTGYTTRAAYSTDGKYVLTGGHDNTARLWGAATGNQVHVFSGHTHDVSAVAFSPDGKYIATGDDPMVRLWDVATGELIREFPGHQAWVSGLVFSPDGRFLLSGSGDRTARLWDVETGKTIRVFGGHADFIQDVAFSSDGKLVATAGNDKIARVWNLQALPEGVQYIGHTGAVGQASFSPDGKQVVTASEDGTARIWDTATGQTIRTLIGHTGVVRGAIFSPDGKTVLTTSADTTARLWNVATGKELRRFEGHTDTVYRAAFSPDGTYIVTTGWDNTARIWNVQTGQAILTYTKQNSAYVIRIAFSPDGKTVATSGDDGTAHIWDPHSGKDLMVFKQDFKERKGVTGIGFSPDGKYLVTGSYEGEIRVWEISSGKEIRRFTGHRGWVFSTVFSPDGKYVLSSGADGTARLWDVQTGQEVRRFTGHTNEVRNATFSPDGKYVLTASNDGTARLWLTDLDDTIRAVCALLTRDLTSDERVQFGVSDQGPTCPAE